MVSQLSHAQSHAVRTACSHDCPDACAMLVTVEHGRAVEVAANPAHPITGHHLCAKVNRYLERVYSPDRLLVPLPEFAVHRHPQRAEPLCLQGRAGEKARNS
jgi:anaerobic selenocysteine-containing dehydrogenase